MLITIVTATGLEFSAARRAVGRDIPVIRAGVGLRGQQRAIAGAAISCGLAGGLREDLPTGTVLIPRSVTRPDGRRLDCDAHMRAALIAAAGQLGHRVVEDPLITSEAIVHGRERAHLARSGYAGVDMETGRIIAQRIACVRVILDTPVNELSPAWQHPARVVLTPKAWRDLPFLARAGPRCARLAAAIAARALDSSEVR